MVSKTLADHFIHNRKHVRASAPVAGLSTHPQGKRGYSRGLLVGSECMLLRAKRQACHVTIETRGGRGKLCTSVSTGRGAASPTVHQADPLSLCPLSLSHSLLDLPTILLEVKYLCIIPAFIPAG